MNGCALSEFESVMWKETNELLIIFGKLNELDIYNDYLLSPTFDLHNTKWPNLGQFKIINNLPHAIKVNDANNSTARGMFSIHARLCLNSLDSLMIWCSKVHC